LRLAYRQPGGGNAEMLPEEADQRVVHPLVKGNAVEAGRA
jgi:hypothetical protein